MMRTSQTLPRRPAPVASLPPRAVSPSVRLSMPRYVRFSMPIDTLGDLVLDLGAAKVSSRSGLVIEPPISQAGPGGCLANEWPYPHYVEHHSFVP